MSYNTGNPIGSQDPRDAADNKENFDRFALSTAPTYTDRLGVARRTVNGAMQAYAAYNNRGLWTTATAYNVNDVWRDGSAGAFYLVLADYTSGASAAADISGTNVTIYQPKLANDIDMIAGTPGVLPDTEQVRRNHVAQVATIAALRNLEPAFDGQQAELLGHTVAGVGGGMFYADYSSTAADDNGVTVVTAGGKRWLRKVDAFVTPEMFGAIQGDDATSAVQAVLNSGYLGSAPDNSSYEISSTLYIDRGCKGFCGNNYLFDSIDGDLRGNYFDYTGTGNLFEFASTDSNKTVPAVRLENFGIRLNALNSVGISWTQATYCKFKNIFVRLLNSGQSAFRASGNGFGSAPYYNEFDGIAVFGNNDAVNYPAQVGFYCTGDGLFMADGPNANTFSNINHLVGIKHGFIFASGVGNLINNVVFESIQDSVFLIGSGDTPSEGRAAENKISNVWGEGSATAVLAKFGGLAAKNRIVGFSVNSTSSVIYEDSTPAKDNFVSEKGESERIVYSGSAGAASITSPISPTSPDWVSKGFGGVMPTIRGYPIKMTVSCVNVSGSIVGSAIVKMYRTGVLNPVMQFTITEATRYGIINNVGGNLLEPYNSFDGTTNSQCEVVIQKSADWNQPSALINVSVEIRG